MATNPTGFVYGTIVVGSLLATETAQHETYAETIAAILLALLVYWLAHAYAKFAGVRLELTERITLRALAHSLADEATLLLGAALPVAAIAACWAAGASLSTGATVGVWTAVAMTLLIEIAAAVRARLTGLALILQSALGLLLGVLVIAIKVVLH